MTSATDTGSTDGMTGIPTLGSGETETDMARDFLHRLLAISTKETIKMARGMDTACQFKKTEEYTKGLGKMGK